ncbi:MAG: hypothetical protein M1428_04830, partial [Deltaproteobacteria bacterium]|nr:hypothetical protein [Deltaproteobacteria bacterium]
MILLMLGAALSAGISVFIIVFEGIAFLEQGADVYREKVENQVKELDELYIKMVPQKLFYLNITSCFLMFVLVSILTSSILLGVLCSP